MNGRTFAALRVFWPSKRFADDDLIPGGGAASAASENHAALIRTLQGLKRDPERLGGRAVDPARTVHIDAALLLLPRLEADAAARRAFVEHLRALLDRSAASPDDASEAFFASDAEALFAQMKDPVVAPFAKRSGGAAAFDAQGSAAGLGDLLSGFLAGARRIANYTTYYAMKQRAGTIGTLGLAPLLCRIREQAPAVRVHLVGHSFGGRLVDGGRKRVGRPDACDQPDAAASRVFAQRHGRAVRRPARRRLPRAADQRAHLRPRPDHAHQERPRRGHRLPARFAASRAAKRPRSATRTTPTAAWAATGRNARRRWTAVRRPCSRWAALTAFAPGKVFNLNADAFIGNHGDVAGPQVAYALLHAVRAV